MNAILSEHKLSRRIDLKGLSFILGEGEELDSGLVSLIKEDSLFVDMSVSYHGDRTKIVYETASFMPFRTALWESTAMAMKLLTGLGEAVLSLRKRGDVVGCVLDRLDDIYADEEGTIRFCAIPVKSGHDRFAYERFADVVLNQLAQELVVHAKEIGRISPALLVMMQGDVLTFKSLAELTRRATAAFPEQLEAEETPVAIDGESFPPPPFDGDMPSPYVRLEGFHNAEGFSFTTASPSYVLGKHVAFADGVLDNEFISKRHCVLFSRDGEYYLSDLGSLNGTWVNDDEVLVSEERIVKEGDVITLADMEFSVVIRRGEARP